MRIIRYQTKNESPRYGWLYEDQVGPLEGSIFGEFKRHEATLLLAEVQLLPPVLPSKVVCVGRNYAEHAREHQSEVPEYPLIFLKPPTTVIGPGAAIVLPPQSQQVEHEAELAVVISKRGRWIAAEDVRQYILGYTIANDVTARDLQRKDGQWTRGKGFDTFCPLGPWIDTEFDPADAMITCHVNGIMRQMASTRDMVFNIAQLMVFASSVMTLEPGDILLTGTPAGVGPLAPGDVVEVKIDGLGGLQNKVQAEAGHTPPSFSGKIA
jgi:2-keto-4-pentenoate hydratase/2-oxohepta-3-ene-1,7-dioic acid hydratase in catechol pathway